MLMKLKLSLTLTNFVMLVCSLNKKNATAYQNSKKTYRIRNKLTWIHAAYSDHFAH